MKKPQNILCVTAYALNRLLGSVRPDGLNCISIDAVEEFVSGHSFLALRNEAIESNEEIKQIVSQIVLVYGDTVCIHQIPESGEEARLRGRWPILFGGHIDDTDAGICLAAIREIREEVGISGKIIERRFLGLLDVNNQDAVSRCHVGAFFIFESDSPVITLTGDNGVKNIGFLTINQLHEREETLTVWSRAALPAIESYIAEKKAKRPPLEIGAPVDAQIFVAATPDYDRSIHTNPDAKAWAKFFMDNYGDMVINGNDPFSDGADFSQTEDWMQTWFANAMMAIHDFEANKRRKEESAEITQENLPGFAAGSAEGSWEGSNASRLRVEAAKAGGTAVDLARNEDRPEPDLDLLCDHAQGFCKKAPHDGEGDYGHGPSFDGMFVFQGQKLCGRCHEAL